MTTENNTHAYHRDALTRLEKLFVHLEQQSATRFNRLEQLLLELHAHPMAPLHQAPPFQYYTPAAPLPAPLSTQTAPPKQPATPTLILPTLPNTKHVSSSTPSRIEAPRDNQVTPAAKPHINIIPALINPHFSPPHPNTVTPHAASIHFRPPAHLKSAPSLPISLSPYTPIQHRHSNITIGDSSDSTIPFSSPISPEPPPFHLGPAPKSISPPIPPLPFDHPPSKTTPPPSATTELQQNVSDKTPATKLSLQAAPQAGTIPTKLQHLNSAIQLRNHHNSLRITSGKPSLNEVQSAPTTYVLVTNRLAGRTPLNMVDQHIPCHKLKSLPLPHCYAPEEMAKAETIPPEPPPYPMNNSRRVFLKTG